MCSKAGQRSRSLQSLSANFSLGSGLQTHTVTAANGAVLNLSGLESTTSPVVSGDILEFKLTDAISSMDLSSLSAVSGSGTTEFNLSNGATLSLPALATVNNAAFNVSSGSMLQVE